MQSEATRWLRSMIEPLVANGAESMYHKGNALIGVASRRKQLLGVGAARRVRLLQEITPFHSIAATGF